jgi:nitrogen fixation protein FixH
MRDMIHPHRDAPAVEPRRHLDGRHVLAMCVVFFGVVFVVNGYMLFSALSTYTGVVSVEPYRKGLAYNDRIVDDDRQIAVGWRDSVNLDQSGTVTVRMTTRDGAPLPGLSVSGVLGRPATARGDRGLTFAEVEPGRYRALAGPVDPGTWMITLEAFHSSDHVNLYRAKRRLWLKS